MAMPATWQVSMNMTKARSRNGGSLKALKKQNLADRKRVNSSGVAKEKISTQIQATYRSFIGSEVNVIK